MKRTMGAGIGAVAVGRNIEGTTALGICIMHSRIEQGGPMQPFCLKTPHEHTNVSGLNRE